MYGAENVAHIVTFGKMTPKAVTRKVMSAFGGSQVTIKQINACIMDDDKTIESALERSQQLRRFEEQYPEQFQIIKRLQNTISHEGMHAGGIVIYDGLASHMPIKTKYGARGDYIIGFDKYGVEEIGFWKLDVLGLETLPVLKRALDNIRSSTGEEIDLHKIDYNDPEVYKMLSSGDVSGVFQLANQASKIIEQRPTCFDDLIAINSLIRPGVGDWDEYISRRKTGEYTIYPAREEYYADTVGTLTYQEQFLLDAHKLCGWGIAYADKHLRKNKDITNDEATRTKFIEDGVSNGHPQNVMIDVWSEIEHAVSGGLTIAHVKVL